MTQQKKRMSIISEFIIFLILVLISIIFLKSINNINSINSSNSYENIKYENKMYVKNIKDKYGINIIYGDDSKDLVSNVDGNVQDNINIINTNLIKIKNELEKYPEDIYNIFKSKKYPLKIVLLDSFNNNNLALTSKSTLNEFKIYISNTNKYEKAFHHEMYHVLEYYVSDTHKNIYKEWNNLNPENFEYSMNLDSLNNEYVLMKLKDYKQSQVDIYEHDINPYFITMYSKTSEREDRAEIFSEIMILEYKPVYLKNGQHILKKVNFLDNVIKQCISNNKFYYDKYIN